MTALAFLRIGQRLLLLSGEGPFLLVYDQYTRQLESSKRIFNVENVHGIKVPPDGAFGHPSETCKDILTWAGSSICLANIESQDDVDGHARLIIKLLIEAQAEDWIQDLCFRPFPEKDASSVDAVFLTSHNVLYSFGQDRTSASHKSARAAIRLIAAGPSSLLYCAHIVWPAEGPGLVAAGTVFGNVFLWSFPSYHSLKSSLLPVPHCLHSTLVGHEGSIFGVRISEPCFVAGSESPRRLIASCSDDRTIRVWDMSRRDHAEQERHSDSISRGSGRQAGIVTGHKSRIWGVRFVGRDQESMRILSYGEDCSSQSWRIGISTGNFHPSSALPDLSLQHELTFVSHYGKNIWALDVFDSPTQDSIIASGGADGRIVCFILDSQKGVLSDRPFSHQCLIEDLRLNVRESDGSLLSNPSDLPFAISPSLKTTAIFAGLKGDWKLVRSLKSAILAYPSGAFDGLASFRERIPTDPAFDNEYLYSEDGQFKTQQGFTLSATRRYVYRYHQGSNQISAWFVKSEDGITVDYLFHVLKFPVTTPETERIIVKAHHLCNEDNYWVQYIFQYHNYDLNELSIKYVVKGPNKDYTADATYTRDTKVTTATGQTTSHQVSIGPLKNCAYHKKFDEDTIHTVPFEGSITSIVKGDSFRSYGWIDDSSFLVTTSDGWLLLGSFKGKSSVQYESSISTLNETALKWTSIVQNPALRSSCILSDLGNCGVVLITGEDGIIYCFQSATRTMVSILKLPKKIACLNTSRLELKGKGSKIDVCRPSFAAFASCLGSSIAYHLTIDRRDEMFHCNQIELKLPANFIPTSSLYIESNRIMILGFRNGSLAVYNLSDIDGPVNPKLVTPSVHGTDSVTSINRVPYHGTGRESEAEYLLSTGRDGRYAVHLLSTCSSQQSSFPMNLQTVHACSLPFGPNIEGTVFDGKSREVLVWGFRGKDFVVWNDSLKSEVMSVECGGAYRNWAFLPSKNVKRGGNLVWTKASTLNVYAPARASHNVLQHGGHGREIKAMALSPSIESIEGSGHPGSRFLATGAEDTTIRVFKSTHEDDPFQENAQRLAVLSKHTTGIQQLRWSSDGRLLFSAAGREELFVWRIQPVPCFPVGTICLSKCPPVTEARDLRIMGFDIIGVPTSNKSTTRYILGAVYSNSTLRVSQLRRFWKRTNDFIDF